MSYIINKIKYPGVTDILGIKDKGTGILQWAVNCAIEEIKANCFIDVEINLNNDNQYKEFLKKNHNILEQARTAWKTTRDDTADIGTLCHDLVEQFVKMKMANYGKNLTIQLSKEEEYLRNIKKYQPVNILQMFYQFYNWQNKYVKKFLKSEQCIVNETLCYAGTADIVYQDYRNDIWLIDLKTKNALYGGEAEQSAAYMLAMNKMESKVYDVKSRYGEYQFKHESVVINKCGVLMIARDFFDLQFFDYTKKYESRLNAFCKLLDFFYADKKRRLKNNHRVGECI